MEATNPRASIPEAWAPPPPVATTPALAEEVGGEDALDAVMGNLVEQFHSLPPPAYGEPPAELDQPIDAPMAALPSTHPIHRTAKSEAASVNRWSVPLAAAISMLIGGAITLLLMVGPQNAWNRLAGNEGGAGVRGDAPKVVVTFDNPTKVEKLAAGPKAEPLEPMSPKTASPQKAVAPKVQKAVAPVQAKKARPKARKSSTVREARKPRRGKRKVAAVKVPKRKKAASSPKKGGGDWEDPYK